MERFTILHVIVAQGAILMVYVLREQYIYNYSITISKNRISVSTV